MNENIINSGPVIIDTNNIPNINLTTKSVNSAQNRKDKSVVITDENGKKQKTSSIMMGYNKAGIVLGDGNFVSEEDIQVAIEQALAKEEEGTFIVNKNGERLDISELVEIAKLAAGAIIIDGPSLKVTNQDSRKWSIAGKNGEAISKGVAFLGNKGIELKPGIYVSIDEIEKALKDYVFATKKDEKKKSDKKKVKLIGGNDTERQNDENKDKLIVVRVDKKIKTSILPLIVAGVIFVTSGLTMTDDVKAKAVEKIVETPSYVQVIDYDVYRQYGILETEEETINRIISTIQMGDDIKVNDGQTFNANSLGTGTNKTMGDEFTYEGKEEGLYRVSGFSIVVNGEIIEFNEDFDGIDNTTKLQDFIDETKEKHNLDENDMEVKIHLGINGDYTRLGWIDISDLINKDTITKDMIQEKIESECVISGTIMNYNGKSIPLPDGSYIVIVDDNGNYLKPGSKVTASNGKEYILEGLNVTQEERTSKETITTYENEVVGKKITWKLKDIGLIASLAPALFTIINAINNKKKNINYKKEPSFFEFATEKQYQDFREKLRKSKEKYESTSKFGKVMKRIFIGKRVDVMKTLTSVQAEKLYSIIKKHAGVDFVLGSNDTIKIKEGKIIIYYQDGHFLDITDIVLKDIAHIGANNKIVETGLLEREIDNEFKAK